MQHHWILLSVINPYHMYEVGLPKKGLREKHCNSASVPFKSEVEIPFSQQYLCKLCFPEMLHKVIPLLMGDLWQRTNSAIHATGVQFRKHLQPFPVVTLLYAKSPFPQGEAPVFHLLTFSAVTSWHHDKSCKDLALPLWLRIAKST